MTCKEWDTLPYSSTDSFPDGIEGDTNQPSTDSVPNEIGGDTDQTSTDRISDGIGGIADRSSQDKLPDATDRQNSRRRGRLRGQTRPPDRLM